MIAYIWTSSPQQILQQTQVRIKKHIETFDKEVQSIHRQEVRSQNLQRIRSESHQEQKDDPQGEISSERASRYTVTTVSMFRKYTFTGRDDELQLLHAKFLPSQPPSDQAPSPSPENPICCVVHGLGGTGKTQLALEYTYRYREEYDAIFWMPSETDHEIAAHFALIAFKLKLVEDDSQDDALKKKNQVVAIQEARNWLHETGMSSSPPI